MKDLKITPILVALLIVSSFLMGSMWTKIRYLEGGDKVKITQSETKPSVAPPPENIQASFTPKTSGRPQVKFFVMSYCPFGIQAEDGLEPVYQLLKDKVDWQPRYVIYKDYCARATGDEKTQCEKSNCFQSKGQLYCSMHGIAELNQDIREICAFKMGDLDKWWKFVAAKNKNCTVSNIETCWKNEAKNAGLDTAAIEKCFNNEKFTLAQKETEEMDKYQAMGSPMVFINEVSYDGGRAPEDYKKAICSSFDNKPKECDEILGTETAPSAGGCN